MRIQDVLVIFFIILALILMANLLIRRVVVYEHERGLLYRNGRFVRIAEPGAHAIARFWDMIQKVDMRIQSASINGQDVLSSDNISIKITLAATYRISDPYKALNNSTHYASQLYLELQLALRDMVGSLPIDELLAKRKQIGQMLLEEVKPKADELGLDLLSVGIKDIMFPGELKNIFAQIVSARNEGLAALEKARGESAAMRSLVNTAHLMDENPALFQLRLLQALGSSSGNTLILSTTSEPNAVLNARLNKVSPTKKQESPEK
jgi:regulator of protease activity HflC (stomatin/prohibitin superfamily)